jgi:hypothetical protein
MNGYCGHCAGDAGGFVYLLDFAIANPRFQSAQLVFISPLHEDIPLILKLRARGYAIQLSAQILCFLKKAFCRLKMAVSQD